ncbi:hypothetical protein IAI18_18230 [Acetobacteraceae bacterium H6797]|nr:hypothetical protein [Acetobacteraceae bacterium H6797]
MMPIPGPGQAGGSKSGPAELPGGGAMGRFCLALAALAVGESRIENLPPDSETLRLAAALEALGARLASPSPGLWRVHGAGIGGLGEPPAPLDMGTDEQGFALVAALLAAREGFGVVTAELPGERPGLRDAMALLGARTQAPAGRASPLAIAGARDPRPLDMPVAAEDAPPLQAAILMALGARGQSRFSGQFALAEGLGPCLTLFGITWNRTESHLAIEGQPELGPVHLRLTR